MDALRRASGFTFFVLGIIVIAGIVMLEKGIWTNDVRGYVTVSEELQAIAVARLTEILGMVRDAEALAPERQK